MSADIANVEYHAADVGYYRRCQLLSPMSHVMSAAFALSPMSAAFADVG
jgi:hypothetical protein